MLLLVACCCRCTGTVACHRATVDCWELTLLSQKKRSKNGESNGRKWVKKASAGMVPKMYLVPCYESYDGMH
jgi:hypothetical protein